MLGRIKVLEANVQDLYSMCHDEFETNMSSKCYKHCKNLAELIQSLKQDVMSNSLNHPYDKAGHSKMYDKLCNLESDVLELMNSVKPIEPKKFHKTRAPKTGRTCKSCQRKFGLPVNQSYAEKTPRYYSRSRRRRVIENDDWSGDNIDHFDRLSYVDLKNGPRARKLYRYPSNESLSTSSSSNSSILVEEYCVVPKKEKENYRIVREGLPFRVEKSKSRNTLNNMRRSSPKQLRNRVVFSARKYDPRDLERYYEYKETPKHRKKRKKKHKDMKEGSEIYFVRKTKDPTQSGFNIRNGSKGPNDKYLVSRLRRIPTGDFAAGESSVNTDRGKKYSQSYRGKKCSSDSNNSQTSIESGFIKSKWRRSPDLRKQSRRPMKKEPLFPQNYIVAQSSNVNTTPLRVQRPSCDDNSVGHNARRQDNQTYRIRKCKLQSEDFKTKSDNRSSAFIVNSNYEVIDSFYGSRLNTEDTRNGKNYLHSKTPLAHSLYVNKAPLYETSARETPALINVSSSGHYPNGKRKRMRRKMKPFRGSQNQINVYQIHRQTQSNPFIKNEADNKSSLTVFTSLKESLSFLKPRKSTVTVEAPQHNIDYSNNREVGDVNDQQTAPSPRKSIVTSPVAKASKTRLSKTGSKIKNLVGMLSGLRKQDSKNRSQSSFMQSDPNAKEESIYKQATREDTDSSKLKSDMINSRISGRILVTPSPQVDARNHRLTNNIDINKPSVKGLLYSLRYDKETRQDFECNDWPIISSLDHFGSNCTILLSEEKIDLSEHKLNGEHNEVHTHHISPQKTKEANNEREIGRRISPKLTDLKPTSYKEFNDVDWKVIVNELKES